MLNNICFNNFAQKSSPGAPLLSAYSWLLMALVLAQMFLDFQENIKPTQFYMQNNICLINFAQKSSPVSVLAFGLLQAVYGPGLGPDWMSRKTLTNPVLYAEQHFF